MRPRPLKRWTAIVPLKGPGRRKSRLAAILSTPERDLFADRLAAHVISVLSASPSVARIRFLSDSHPRVTGVDWARDGGAGLNVEIDNLISEWRHANRDIDTADGALIVLPDLPFLKVSDIELLIDAAGDRIAFAPDRSGTGTNAIALGKTMTFRPSFGRDSLNRHCAQFVSPAIVSGRIGLGLDLDTPQDLASARSLGWAAMCSAGTAGPTQSSDQDDGR